MKNLQNPDHEEQDWTTVLLRRTEEPTFMKENRSHEESAVSAHTVVVDIVYRSVSNHQICE